MPSRNAAASAGLAEQLGERVGEALGLEDARALDRAAGADDGVAGAGQHGRVGVDRARAGLQLAHEAVVQAARSASCWASLRRGRRTRATTAIESRASQRLLDAAEPAHEARERQARNAVGEQEVQVALRASLRTPSGNARSVYIVVRAWSWTSRLLLYGLGAGRRGAGAARRCKRAWSCRGPSTPRSPATRAWPGASPRWCPATPTTRSASSAPTARRPRSRRGAAPAFARLSAPVSRRRFAHTLQLTAEAKAGLSDLQFTGRLPRAVPVQRLRARAPAGRRVPASPRRA